MNFMRVIHKIYLFFFYKYHVARVVHRNYFLIVKFMGNVNTLCEKLADYFKVKVKSVEL